MALLKHYRRFAPSDIMFIGGFLLIFIVLFVPEEIYLLATISFVILELVLAFVYMYYINKKVEKEIKNGEYD